MTSQEVWLPVVGHEQHYAVSNLGRIRSTHPKKGKTPRILSPIVTGRGYQVIRFAGEKTVAAAVHRVVCAAFHGPPPTPDALCRHINDQRSDNRAENLCWGSEADNKADSRRNGTLAVGGRINTAKLTAADVLEIRRLTETGVRNADLSRRYGVSERTIGDVVRGKNWKHLLPSTTDVGQAPGIVQQNLPTGRDGEQ